jgi:oligoendopeptidase F
MKLTTKWNLSKLGSAINDPKFTKERKKVERASKAFAKKWQGNRAFVTKAKALREALDQYEELARMGQAEGYYLALRGVLDADDTKIQAASALYRNYALKISDYTRFFELELGKIPAKKQQEFLKSKDLEPYRNYLRGIFNSAKYFLSEKEEKILSLKSGVASGNWVDMLEEFLSTEMVETWVVDDKTKKLKKQERGFADLMNLIQHKNKKVSTSAIAGVKFILNKHAKVAEKEMNSFLENKKINDELRGFKRPDSSRHNAEDIDTKAVDTLIEVVSDNYKLARDYYTFKTKLLGRKNIEYWERMLKYGKVNKTYPYKDGVDLVSSALEKISDEFADHFKDFTVNGHIDVYPKKGKRSGAFCASLPDQPTMIMLNYGGTVRDLTTLAHEMGHGVHAQKAQQENALNFGHPMCTSEVASTFCEDFVIDELLGDLSDEDRLVVMVEKLEDKVATIFRQVAAYQFEQELHETFRKNGYLSNKEIGTLFNKHMKNYMGNSVKFDDDSALGWVYWGHFRTPFYVYAYSMALLVAQAARKRFDANPKYIEKINEFYSTGSSRSPKEIYASLGMNINSRALWQEGIDEVKELLKETKKLAKKLGKI